MLETHFKFRKLLPFSLSISPLSLTFMPSFSIDAQWSRVVSMSEYYDESIVIISGSRIILISKIARCSGVREWKIIIISTWVRELKAKERWGGEKLFQTVRITRKVMEEKSIKTFLYFIILILSRHPPTRHFAEH